MNEYRPPIAVEEAGRPRCTSPYPLPTTRTRDDSTTLSPDAALPEQFFDPPPGKRTDKWASRLAANGAQEAIACD
ncbi:MAG: hypothetical protein AB7G75_06350 [Candidatus Binatia bacterium]